MRILCWIPKAKRTHSQYVILIASPLQQWLHERALSASVYLHRPSFWTAAFTRFVSSCKPYIFLGQAIALINFASNFISWLLGLYQSV